MGRCDGQGGEDPELGLGRSGHKYTRTDSPRQGAGDRSSLARELPNLSLAGYWWHNFFPEVIRQIIGERLDILPASKQVGFFSDAYCIEWTYAKAILVRRQLARVLGQRIEQDQFTFEEAVRIAEDILFQTPQKLLGMVPRA